MKKKFHWLNPSVPLIAFFLSQTSFAFTENDFEKLVLTENAELNALYEKKEALRNSDEEAELIYGWQVIGGLNKRIDKRLSNDPSFTYDSIETLGAQLGLQKQFSFGLESKLSLNSTQTEITNGNAGGVAFDSKFWETQPILDLKLPLLSGRFGRKLKADYQLNLNRKRLEALEAEVAYDNKMNEAKILLWSTVLQKELLASQVETLNRIEKIYSIVSKKAAQSLEASSNFLQTRSALELVEMDLKNVQLRYAQLERLLKLVVNKVSDLQMATYDFKKFKKVDLVTFNGKITAQEKIISFSEDVQNQSTILASEMNRSRLDLFASMALNGQDQDWNESIRKSEKGRNPTNLIGIQWVIPLDQGITGRAIDRQSVLSRASLAKKKYYQTEQKETVLHDLVSQYNQMVDMLALNLRLEKTQSEKLKNERQLLNQGRSSIYQVLQFELDLARARAGKFSLAIELEKSQQQLSQYRYNSYE
jgi:outer membrane protein TolC